MDRNVYPFYIFLHKTKAPHSKAAGRIDHAPRSAERTCPATARPGCWRYKMPQAVSSDLPGTPVALPLGELAAKQTERAIKGYTSSRKSLGVSFFEENAAVPTHRRCTLLSVKRWAQYNIGAGKRQGSFLVVEALLTVGRPFQVHLLIVLLDEFLNLADLAVGQDSALLLQASLL